ncbi:hypothetical protein GCM10020000_30300 [Streptomyces olivoverticillatus]
MEKRVMTYGKRRKALAAAAAVLGGVLTLAACGGDGDDAKGGGSDKKSQGQVDAAAAKDASTAQIKITPKGGTANASINAVQVAVDGGELTSVKMTTEKGDPVEGSISSDKKTWKPSKQLERSTKYKVVAEAKDDKGRKATENSAFTTVSPDNSFIGAFTPEDGSTVGVGMPVSINFDKPIKDRKAVQSHLEVSSSSGQKVVGHWFGDQRIDFRPQEYWKANSDVTLKMDLDGVEGAPGIKGVQKKTINFKIGRSQVSTVDAKTHQMTVVRDGKTFKTIPISAQQPVEPDVQRQDGDLREVRGDPDGRLHRGLLQGRRQGRVRHQGRAARHAAVHVGHLHPRQLLGQRRLRRLQHQPRLRGPGGQAGRGRPEHLGRLVLLQLRDR